MKLTSENFILYAAHHYDNPSCNSTEEFLSDLNHFKYLKKLFSRHSNGGDLKIRLVLNHLTIIINLFGVHAAPVMIFHKMDSTFWPEIKTFLLFLNCLPKIIEFDDKIVILDDIEIKIEIVNQLKKL